jgi:hypothetical protein
MNKKMDANVTIVRSENTNLPATSKPVRWREFNKFVEDAEALREYSSELNTLRYSNPDSDGERASGDVEDDAEWLTELVARCKEGFERFNRADNYDADGTLSETYVAKRLGVMVGAFPNVNPGTPKDYARMLVEHVAAVDGLTDVALEGACREIVETRKFAPAIAEVMTTITDHVHKWQDWRKAVFTIEYTRQMTIETLALREREAAKRAHDKKVEQASYAARRAIETTQRLAKEIEVAKAALAAVMQRHAEAEKRESNLLRELRKLATPPEEAEADAESAKAEALAKHNGSGAKLL